MMKTFLTIASFTLFMSIPAIAADIPFPEKSNRTLDKAPKIEENTDIQKTITKFLGPRPGHTGYYLAGRHAQAVQDWHAANHYLDIAARKDPQNVELKRRAMVIAMGAGDLKTAADYGVQILRLSQGDPLATLFVAAQSLKDTDYKTAENLLNSMNTGGMAEFAAPLILAWTHAAQGEFNIDALSPQPLHAFHVALIANQLEEESSARAFIEKVEALSKKKPSLKLADTLFVLNQRDKALSLYKLLLKDIKNISLKKRINALNRNKKAPFYVAKTPKDGIALAFLDMAKILSAEDSMDSARIFGHIALNIDPSLEQAHILLAKIYTDTAQYGPALAHYNQIPADSPYAVEIAMKVSGIYEDHGNIDKALGTLARLNETRPSVDLTIQKGDILRRDAQYKQAIQAYNAALLTFDNNAPDEYWFVYYTRGMAAERLGQWSDAEADFIKSLEYRPNEPFVLNYLAYGWAERGINLSKSLEYLEKAAARAPDDGHIKDSLGWALYKLGRYEDAIEPLEQAILFLPYDAIVNEHLGDAYWQVGRQREAMFQWQRAFNHVDANTDDNLTARLEDKLINGLPLQKQTLSAENSVESE